MSCRRLSVSLLFTVLMSAAEFAGAQAVNPPSKFPSSIRPGRIVVDGSTNPERIPDRVAIGMFMSSIAIPAPTDLRTVKSMYARVAPLKLSPRDMSVLRTELAALHARLQTHRETLNAARDNFQRLKTPAVAATFTAVAEARDTLAVDSYERLLTALTPGAAGKLRAHINIVKKQMKVIGPAN